MNVWIVNIGENLPTDGKGTRIFRCGILAEHLVNRGHNVIWWTSTFDHYNKVQRYKSDIEIIIRKGYKIKFLKGSGYSKNISLRRLWDHYILGMKFSYQAKREADRPDVIISSFPIVSLSHKAVLFGMQYAVPVVLDARDMWPDIFTGTFPKLLKPIGRFLMLPMQMLTQKSFRSAYSVTGMTDAFVEWGLTKGSRVKTNVDISFPFGYFGQKDNWTPKELNSFCETHNINCTGCKLLLVGHIGGVLNIDFLVDCAKVIEFNHYGAEIIVCGIGNHFEDLKQRSAELTNIKLLGWLDGKEISQILQISAFGIIPYKNRNDFLASVPNKVPEYMSRGLPVISSLGGTVKDIINKNDCGLYIDTPSDILKAIEIYYNNKSKYDKWRENSLSYFEKNFDANVVYENMSKYLEQINIDYRRKMNNTK